MFDRNYLRTGMAVYSSDGHKIGAIGGMGQYYFKCDTGFLGLGTDLYIPIDFVERFEEDGVYLSVPMARIGEMGWDREPAGWLA